MIFRYRWYQWSTTCPGYGWVLVVELERGWVSRLWGKHDED